MSSTVTLPTIMTATGLQPQSPDSLRAQVLALAQSYSPGLTGNLPGSLVEDLLSTAVAALAVMDSARVDSVNDVTPDGANVFVLNQQGPMLGITPGLSANASVYVQFSGSSGYVIPPGFAVSDGTYTYLVQDGGVVSETTGLSELLYAVCTSSGTFAIPANTVVNIETSVPSPYTLAVTNPAAGVPATTNESVPSYRARVHEAIGTTCTGTMALVKSNLAKITGVQSRLVSVIPHPGGGWEVICGGGDAYSVANAILSSMPDISALRGSQLAITGITAANPAVITTGTNSSFAVGQTFTLAGATPAAYNTTYTVVSVTGNTITTNVDSSAFGAYTGGAAFSPNPRDVNVTLYQAPNNYNIVSVYPSQEIVAVAALWNTTLTNFTAGASVNQLAIPAIQNYINSIPVGSPINLLELQAAFQDAVSSVISPVNLTTLEFTVTVNDVVLSPAAGTSIISSDPESYFYCSPTSATSAQG